MMCRWAGCVAQIGSSKRSIYTGLVQNFTVAFAHTFSHLRFVTDFSVSLPSRPAPISLCFAEGVCDVRIIVTVSSPSPIVFHEQHRSAIICTEGLINEVFYVSFSSLGGVIYFGVDMRA